MKMKKTLLVMALMATIIMAGQVTAWVPPYSIGECKTMLEKDFGGVSMADGITMLPLQFWHPDGASVKKAYGSTPSDSDIYWFRDWAHNNGIKALFCIFNPPVNGNNYWDWDGARNSFWYNQDAFVQSIVNEVERLGLDGADIDLEGNQGSSEDEKAAFLLFMTKLSTALHEKGKILTTATFAGSWSGNVPNSSWWSELYQVVDHIGSMGYDYCGPYAGGDASYQSQLAVTSNAEQLLIGMPGWMGTWQGGYVTDQIDWVMNNSNAGICIWDAGLTDETGAWQTAAVWNRLSALVDKDKGPYQVSVSEVHGTVSLTPYMAEYPEGTVITAEAEADPGYLFVGWSSGETESVREITVDRSYTLTPLFANLGEQVQNGSFEDGDSEWTFSVSSGANGAGSVEGDYYKTTVQTEGTTAWGLQLRQRNISLIQDSLYTLTFTAWADAERTIEIKVGESQEPWARYNEGDSTITVTTEPQKFVIPFTMNSPTDMNARIEFNGGLSADNWYIDDVSLKLGEEDFVVPVSTVAKSSSKCILSMANGTMSLHTSVAMRGSVTLYDLKGRVVWNSGVQNFGAGKQSLDLPVTDFASGIYVATLKSSSLQMSQFFTIQR